MHYHMELIMPPAENVETAVRQIMEPFSEYQGDMPNESYNSVLAFYDWYEIGGRWSGSKALDIIALDKERQDAFIERLKKEGVKAMAVQTGKQRLAEEYVEVVDNIWKEMFPGSIFRSCPFFANAGPHLPGDIMQFKDIVPHIYSTKEDKTYRQLNCATFMVAELKELEDGTKTYQASFLALDSIWNGVNWQDTAFEGTINHGIDLFNKKMKNVPEEYRKVLIPGDDWLVVTIDYHC